MFTGIVSHTGTVARIVRRGGGALLEVRAPSVASRLGVGDSVAVNGACVTVTGASAEAFACDLVPETLARTTLGTLQQGEDVNLEMPLRAGERLDGHFVQGHVDAVGVVRSRRRVGAQEVLEVNLPFELVRYLAPKGSVALDGVSLTVVDVGRDRFRVALIPHTVGVTTLGKRGQGATLNVEVDVISKYVERHLATRGLTADSWVAGPAAQSAVPALKPAPAPVRAGARDAGRPSRKPAVPRSAPGARKAAPARGQPPAASKKGRRR